MSQTRLMILEDSASAAEWRIGYVDGEPAVGDAEGRWYIVPDDAIVPQTSQSLVWLLQEGEWSCLHQMHWNPALTPPTSPDRWLADGPAFVEG